MFCPLIKEVCKERLCAWFMETPTMKMCAIKSIAFDIDDYNKSS